MDNSQRTETPAASLCPYCEGRCESQIITLTLRRSPALFAVIRNVPAEVCQICGEAQFSVPTALRLLTALQAEAAPTEVVLTPIYDFVAEV
jgi:YgiT-type zinc finger domain-containing protein